MSVGGHLFADDEATMISDNAVHDRLSDTLHGEGDSDWYMLFALDTIHATERFNVM